LFSYNYTKKDVTSCNLSICKSWLLNLPPNFVHLFVCIICHAWHLQWEEWRSVHLCTESKADSSWALSWKTSKKHSNQQLAKGGSDKKSSWSKYSYIIVNLHPTFHHFISSWFKPFEEKCLFHGSSCWARNSSY
jgi:hypothetical protein